MWQTDVHIFRLAFHLPSAFLNVASCNIKQRSDPQRDFDTAESSRNDFAMLLSNVSSDIIIFFNLSCYFRLISPHAMMTWKSHHEQRSSYVSDLLLDYSMQGECDWSKKCFSAQSCVPLALHTQCCRGRLLCILCRRGDQTARRSNRFFTYISIGHLASNESPWICAHFF